MDRSGLVAAILACAAVSLIGCGRLGYEAHAGTRDAAGTSDAAGTVDAGAGPMAIDCGPLAPTRSWSFDSGEQGFIVQSNGATSMLYWLPDAEGARGVLEADIQPSAEPTWATAIELDGDIGDLRGATVTAAVWVEGEVEAIGVFVQTNGGVTSEYWANGPWTAVSPGTWSCLSLVADAPSFGGSMYDPASVTRLGVHANGSGPARVYVDAIAHRAAGRRAARERG